jgi:hypothetical protein
MSVAQKTVSIANRIVLRGSGIATMWRRHCYEKSANSAKALPAEMEHAYLAASSMKKSSIAALALFAIAVNTSIWLFLNSRAAKIWDENGPMENFQAVCLALTIALLLIAVRFAHERGQRIFLYALALFAASILVLEVDFRRMNAPALNRIMNGRIRDAWLGTLWLVAAMFFVRNMKSVWETFLRWLRSPAGAFMILGGIFWVLSALIDKSILGQKDLFREELMEVNATLLMCASAVFVLVSLSPGKQEKP